MNPLTIFCLILGIHILIARGITGIWSKYKHNWFIGCIEGLPLIISGILVDFEISGAFLFFIVALVLYFCGTFIKNKLDNNAEKKSPEKWLAWSTEKKKINKLLRIILLIF